MRKLLLSIQVTPDGNGTVLLKDLHSRHKLKLLNTRTFRLGIVLLNYATGDK